MSDHGHAGPPVPAGQHAPPADFGALGYGPAAYASQVPAEARHAAAAALEAAVPVVRAAQRAADEAEFAARIKQQQDATQGIVERAVQAERDRIRGLVESYRGSWPFQPPEVQAELLLERLLSQIGGMP